MSLSFILRLSCRQANARLVERRKPHSLSPVEFRILEGRQTNEMRDHCRRQAGPIDVNLISNDDINLFRQNALNRFRLAAARRCHAPRLMPREATARSSPQDAYNRIEAALESAARFVPRERGEAMFRTWLPRRDRDIEGLAEDRMIAMAADVALLAADLLLSQPSASGTTAFDRLAKTAGALRRKRPRRSRHFARRVFGFCGWRKLARPMAT